MSSVIRCSERVTEGHDDAERAASRPERVVMFSSHLRHIGVIGAAVLFAGQMSIAPAAAQDTDNLVARVMTGALLAPSLTATAETRPAGSLDMTAAIEAATSVPTPIRTSAAAIGAPRSSEAVMFPLYAATAALQMLDAHSTLTALANGAREGNPFMAGFANNKFALVGVKAAVAAGMIFSMHRMARHNRVGAIITGIALNSVYAAVVAHNYRIARQTY